MKNNVKIGIIGGGASGLFSAILLKQYYKNIDVTIYEAQNKIGKKILQTGNGKCNLSNTNLSINEYNTKDIENILKQFNSNQLISILNSWGLQTRIDNEGRIYPYSEKATTVLDIFLKQIKLLDINVITDCYITKIDCKENNFIVLDSNNNKYINDYLFVCSGGCSSITYKYNTNYLLSNLGHSVTSLYPSLCALKTKQNTKSLSGIKIKCKASIIVDDILKKETDGEVLFKDDGLSGIAIFILSQFFEKNKNNVISLDLYNDKSIEQLNNELINKDSLENNLTGYFPKMINYDIIKRVKNNNIGKVIKNYNFNIIDSYGFNNSQVTKGGIPLNEINMTNLESKKCHNLYILGEALDVDGSCGGYNLHFAFACGYIVVNGLKGKI